MSASNHATNATSDATRKALLEKLRAVLGRRRLLTGDARTRRFRKGFRFGEGKVLAVARPGSLVEQWRVLKACIEANVIVIPQASNTGLTGGSTPDGEDYDRDIVMISTSRMAQVFPIKDGTQVLCLPGATLHQLERLLRPLGREPHSVIGSSCIGASVFGGVCNNSGGALVQRGPAYTEMALFAKVDAQGELRLVNHLGVVLPQGEEAMLAALDQGRFAPQDVQDTGAAASDHHYADYVREVDADTPARFNADPHRLFEASGSAGKVMVFAVRLDTFPIERASKVFYIGSNRTQTLSDIRREVLQNFTHLPIAGEYMHRDAYNVAEEYGKDTFLAIRYLGTDHLPAMYALKAKFDAFFDRLGFLPSHLTDRIMQGLSRLFPQHLPARMQAFRDRYEHHLLLRVSAEGVAEARAFLSDYFAKGEGAYFECTDDEGEKAFLHRFAAAGAAIRYRDVHPDTVENIVALDIALKRNESDWFERLPASIDQAIAIKLYYGHFLCHVFHQDYIVHKGQDCLALEHQMWHLLDDRGAEYPAEHNVGHLYVAKPALANHYRELDPCNCFNPGIGQMSKCKGYH